MKLLIVEDDENWLAELCPSLDGIQGVEYLLARSRDSALQALGEGFFDAIVLDLKLPTTDYAGDEAVPHGEAVFAAARSGCPGTPILFLTGSSAETLYTDLLATKENVDLWGDREPVATVYLWPKSKVLDFLEQVRGFAARVQTTDQIELITEGADFGLTPEDKRVLKVIGRRFNGMGVRLASATGGLSGARVFRMSVVDGQGHERLRAIGKLSNSEAVRDEIRRCQELHRLQQGDFAPFIGSVEGGAKDVAATFYRLADGYDRNLFDVMAQSADEGARMAPRIRATMAPWLAAPEVKRLTVREVRQRYLADEQAQAFWAEFGWGDMESLERRTLSVRWTCTHGDLHGANVLIGGEGRPALIDFGDVGDACSAIDPLTLEWCLFSHPAASACLGGWKPDFSTPWEQAATYAQSGPVAGFITATRQWAHEVAFGDHDVNANAYGYCLRQLKYNDVDRTFFARAAQEMIGYLQRI